MGNRSLVRYVICLYYKHMKKAKIYIPTKTAMQSGKGKTKKWVLKFETRHEGGNPVMTQWAR